MKYSFPSPEGLGVMPPCLAEKLFDSPDYEVKNIAYYRALVEQVPAIGATTAAMMTLAGIDASPVIYDSITVGFSNKLVLPTTAQREEGWHIDVPTEMAYTNWQVSNSTDLCNRPFN